MGVFNRGFGEDTGCQGQDSVEENSKSDFIPNSCHLILLPVTFHWSSYTSIRPMLSGISVVEVVKSFRFVPTSETCVYNCRFNPADT